MSSIQTYSVIFIIDHKIENVFEAFHNSRKLIELNVLTNREKYNCHIIYLLSVLLFKVFKFPLQPNYA